MTDSQHFLLFLGAAMVLAITPGPGIFYVLARTLAGGMREGVNSALGTFFGGLFHVFAAALGVAAILPASAGVVVMMELSGWPALVLVRGALVSPLKEKRTLPTVPAPYHTFCSR